MSASAAKPRSNRTLWLIIAVAAAPVIASYLAYYFWPPAGRVNYGELIAPVTLPDTPLTLADGAAFRFGQLKGKWVLAMADSGRCGEHCRQKVLYLRQLRLAQGKEQERIERAWLITDDVPVDPELRAQFAGTWLIRAGDVAGALSAQASPADYIYVIDPLGNVILRYPRDPDPQRMIKDLERLLKASQIG